jgi:hypothetical protein
MSQGSGRRVKAHNRGSRRKPDFCGYVYYKAHRKWVGEPPRESWRSVFLRGWADEKDEQAVSGGGS